MLPRRPRTPTVRGAADDGEVPPQPASQRGQRRQQLPIWQEMTLLLGIALVLAVVIKAFFMQAFYIPSASMNDTLVKNDRILVQKVSYWGGGGSAPRRHRRVLRPERLARPRRDAGGRTAPWPGAWSCSGSTRPAGTS